MAFTELQVDKDQLREKIIEVAKRHRASWIEFGQYLYTVYKDKFFKSWGYLSFETYCHKELHIKNQTAQKLLKSYNFLEQEEPRLTRPETTQESTPDKLPNYESVHLLRLAKNNDNLTPQDYAEIRTSVIDKGREPKEVKEQVKKLIAERDPVDPSEERRRRRNSAIKRVITTISMARKELSHDNLLPGYLLKQMQELVGKLTDQIED